MPIVHYNKKSYAVDDNNSLLDSLLEQGIDFPHSCKIGTCQSCLTQLVEGEVPPKAQVGLKSTLIAKNYFLACQCNPQGDMTIALPQEGDIDFAVHIIEMSKLSHNVLRVRLSTDKPECFRGGQYINLVTPENIIRSYSIANVPEEYIELHVKLVPNGLMSLWLTQYAKPLSALHIRGPMGDCFYHNPTHKSFPIVLAGTGTGLAPLIGITEDALKNGHKGKIILIHGVLNVADLYLHQALTALEKTQTNFTYVPCVLNENDTIEHASIEQVLVKNIKGIESEVQLFICGPEETTKKMKVKAFLAAVPSAAISSDSFISASA
jgi:NAD(P)H-flavin reductase